MVIDILLRQNKRDLVLIDCDSMATDATSEILYRICLHRDAHSASRYSVLASDYLLLLLASVPKKTLEVCQIMLNYLNQQELKLIPIFEL